MARPHADAAPAVVLARAVAVLRSALTETPAIYLVAIAIVIGDATGNLRASAPLWIAIALSIVALAAFLSGWYASGIALALAAIACAATVPAGRVLDPLPNPTGIQRFADGSFVAIEGRLIREIERYHGRMHLYVEVERAAGVASGGPPTPFAPASGVVRVTLLEPGDFKLGQTIRVTERIRFPRNYGDPGEFDYEAHMARRGVAATMVVEHAKAHARIGAAAARAIELIGEGRPSLTRDIENVRDRIGTFIDQNLGPPERDIMRALVIGDQGGIDESLRERFALTGMAHLLVISGLHLSIVAAAVFALARLLCGFFPALMNLGYGNKIAAGAAALGVIAYASIAGHRISTMRALVMVLSYVLAVLLDRSREVLASLALAVIVICVAIPGSSADIGFQLSFASVIVIVIGMRRFMAWRERRLAAYPIAAYAPLRQRYALAAFGFVAVSFWAMLGTAPLTAYYFNQFSLIGVIANAVVVPIMGGAGTVLGLSAAALSFIDEPLAHLVLWIAAQFLALGTWLAGWFMRWPLAWFRIFTPTPIELAIAYGMLLLWLTLPFVAVTQADRDAALRSGARWRAIAGLLLLAALLIDAMWWIDLRYFDPALRVTFLAVGEGDSAVVQFPGSGVMVIDGGGAFGSEFDPGERLVARFLWSRKIMHVNYLALSHPELDHFGGLIFIARNFSPGEFWTIEAPSSDIQYAELLAALAEAHARPVIADTSLPPKEIGGVRVRFLNPQPDERASRNDSSMVLRLGFGRVSFLFTGDIEAKGERNVIAEDSALRATVLKVPHHGSHTSSTAPFVAAVHPQIAVMLLGYHNRFHFPAPEVVDRWSAIGARVLRTDQSGAVMIRSDGSALTVRAGRR